MRMHVLAFLNHRVATRGFRDRARFSREKSEIQSPNRALFRDGVASFVTPTLFSGCGCEFCDRPFFRDAVASFVTDPFLGTGLRVL